MTTLALCFLYLVAVFNLVGSFLVKGKTVKAVPIQPLIIYVISIFEALAVWQLWSTSDFGAATLVASLLWLSQIGYAVDATLMVNRSYTFTTRRQSVVIGVSVTSVILTSLLAFG